MALLTFAPQIDKNPVQIAKEVQRASSRSSRLFSFRDWVSYVHLILALAALGWLTLVILRTSGRVHRFWRDLEAEYIVRHGDFAARNLAEIESSALKPVEQDNGFDVADYSGFDIERDARMYDLRQTRPPSGKVHSPQVKDNPTYAERRIVLSRNASQSTSHLRLPYRTRGSAIDLRCRVERDGTPVAATAVFCYSKKDTPAPDGQGVYRNYELDVDLQSAEVGEKVEVITEAIYWDGFRRNEKKEDPLYLKVDTAVGRIELFVILPTDKTVGECHRVSGPDTSDLKTATEGVFSLSKDSNALFWAVDHPSRAYFYRIDWTYMDRGK